MSDDWTLASKSGIPVQLEDFGEIHMGARHLRIGLDRPFDGVAAIHATNGVALWHPTRDILLVGDALLLLLLDFADGSVRHHAAPNGRYFSSPAFAGAGVATPLRGEATSGASPRVLRLDGPEFSPGLGIAAQGLLPSVDRHFHQRVFG